MERGHRAGTAGLVHLRTAMRLDAGRDPPRDRKLDMDGRHLRLHAGAGLCRELRDLPDRGCARGGLNHGPDSVRRAGCTPAGNLLITRARARHTMETEMDLAKQIAPRALSISEPLHDRVSHAGLHLLNHA